MSRIVKVNFQKDILLPGGRVTGSLTTTLTGGPWRMALEGEWLTVVQEPTGKRFRVPVGNIAQLTEEDGDAFPVAAVATTPEAVADEVDAIRAKRDRLAAERAASKAAT